MHFEEQQIKIANYLDTETSKIDRKISILEQKEIIKKIKFKHAGTKEIYVNSKTAIELNLTPSKNTSKAEFVFIP